MRKSTLRAQVRSYQRLNQELRTELNRTLQLLMDAQVQLAHEARHRNDLIKPIPRGRRG